MAGRPRSFDRDEALELALESFWRYGFEETSIARLTDAIGINPPSLYAAFGDKRRLFEEAADRYVAHFRSGLDECLDAPTARAGVAEVMRVAAAAHTDPATPPGCLVLSEPRLAAERSRMRAKIAARIARGRSEGELPADADPEWLAAFVETVMSGMSARARDDRAGHEELAAVAELAIAAFPGSPLDSGQDLAVRSASCVARG